MALNVELLKRLKTRFLRMQNRRRFDMENYAQKTECGTAMCIAGHALDLQGYKVRFETYQETWADNEYHVAVFISPQGRKVNPQKAAMRELGLKDHGLFHEFHLRTPNQAAKRIQRIIDTGKV